MTSPRSLYLLNLVSILLFITSLVANWQSWQLTGFISDDSSSASSWGEGSVSPAVLSATQTAADVSWTIAEQTDSEALREVSRHLSSQVLRLRAIPHRRTKRQFPNIIGGIADGIGSLIPGAGSGAGSGSGSASATSTSESSGVQSAVASASTSAAASDSAADGGLLGGLASVFGGLIPGASGAGGAAGGDAGIGDLLSGGASSLAGLFGGGSLDGVAFSLGMGLGTGSATGLNVATPDQMKAIAAQAAADNNVSMGAINDAAQQLGNGLTGTLVKAIPVSSLSSRLGPAAFAMAQGIGNATASGLKLTNKQFTASSDGSLNGAAGNLGLGIAGPIAQNVNLNQLMASISSSPGMSDAILAAGRGLGEGAVEGLGITKTGAVLTKRALNTSAVAGGFTRGLSASFLQSANLSLLATNAGMNTSAMSAILAQLPEAIPRAGKGLGEGAVLGLGISKAVGIDPNGAVGNGSFPDMTEGFTRSLSYNFLGNANLMAILPSMGPSQAQLGDILVGAGKGLGSGAAAGLGLTKADVAPPNSTSTDPATIAQGFTFALTNNFLTQANLSSATQALTGSVDISGLSKMIVPAAYGLSQGLGKGAAIGLGLQSDPGVASTNSTSMDIVLVTKMFGQGLTQDFLANGTTTKIVAALQAVQANSSVDVAKVMEGFARGSINGVMTGISQAGGIQNVASGNISSQVISAIETGTNSLAFNDSVNGASTAFGSGFGSQGVLLVSSLISGKMLVNSNASQPANQTSTPTRMLRALLTKRDTTAVDMPIVNSSTIELIAQLGIDKIDQCTGVGGLLLIFEGLQESGSFSAIAGAATGNSTSTFLPADRFPLFIGGNRFDVRLRNFSLTDTIINGLTFGLTFALTSLHMTFVIMAYFLILPLIVILNTMRRISALFGSAPSLKMRKWQVGLFYGAYLPLATLGTIMGLVGQGNSRHFRTSHGIIGLGSILASYAGAIVHFFRYRASDAPIDPRSWQTPLALLRNRPTFGLPILNGLMIGVVLFFANIAFSTGWKDLENITFCISDRFLTQTVAIGIGSFAAYGATSMSAVMLVRQWLELRALNRPSTDMSGKMETEGTVVTYTTDERAPRASRLPTSMTWKRITTLTAWPTKKRLDEPPVPKIPAVYEKEQTSTRAASPEYELNPDGYWRSTTFQNWQEGSGKDDDLERPVEQEPRAFA